jgi:hypothetical protein
MIATAYEESLGSHIEHIHTGVGRPFIKVVSDLLHIGMPLYSALQRQAS